MAESINTEFWVWLAVVLVILGGGMGTMVLAYRRPLKNTVIFAAPLREPSIPLAIAAQNQFQQGCQYFCLGQFPRAIDCFTEAIRLEPACAEAFHNCGLAYANLGNDNYAVRALLKAEALYDQQSTRWGVERIKAEMEQLAGRR
jgi:tetratricopeptide (TPR) repeat protein